MVAADARTVGSSNVHEVAVPQPLPQAPEAPQLPPNRLPGGGPAGSAPLIRLMRTKQPEMRRAAQAWLDRYGADPQAALAELVSFILVVADVPTHQVEREDVLDREPADVVQDLVASIAVSASESGADFSSYWLVSTERGAMRLKTNFPAFWKELAITAPYQLLLQGLLPHLRDWLLPLADCQFRSIRHVSAVAALGVVEGLVAQCRGLREFCSTIEIQVQSVQEHHGEARLASLRAESEHTQRSAQELTMARDGMGIALLSRRTKDIYEEVRRSSFDAMYSWSRSDAAPFLEEKWTRYLYFGLNDRHAPTRQAALKAIQELLKGDPGNTTPPLRALAEQCRTRLLARCHDVDPSVSAAAIRCSTLLASRNLLAEDDFDPIADLIWNENAERRSEAASFVSKFIFSEEVLDHHSVAGVPVKLIPTNSTTTLLSRRRVQMLLQFLAEYAEGHYVLVDRLIEALWRRASCLEDWEALASMALPGGEHSLSGEVHTALIHMLDAIARLASQDAAAAASKSKDGDAYAMGVLDRASRTLATKIPTLLSACQAEQAAMRRVASLCRHLLKYCATRGSNGQSSCAGLISGNVGDATTVALSTAFLRQPDPEALEHLAESMAYVLDLAAGARPVIKELASELQGRFLEIISRFSETVESEGGSSIKQSAQSVATRLRILSKAFDVSLCDLRKFGAAVLGLLDDRAMAATQNQCAPISPQLATTLIELLTIVLIRHMCAMIQPGPLADCVVHDPVDEKELQLVPTAVNDLCSVVTALLRADPNQHVRTSAFVAGLSLLTTWWNGTHLAALHDVAPSGWALPLSEDLAGAMWAHLGQLLIEANAVPCDSYWHDAVPEPGNPLHASAYAQMFATLNRALDARGAGNEDRAAAPLSDPDRVRVAIFACSQIASCRHPEVIDGALPALVLSQALSPREDLQNAAWVLMRRLKKELHAQPDSAAEFFLVLLRAVQAVHQDAGVDVARDLSIRLLQHVGVGKLSPLLQSGFIEALRTGVEAAVSDQDDRKRLGLLEALIPWVTKHVVDDDKISSLADWAEQHARAREHIADAGLFRFIAACRSTATKGAAARVDVADGEVATPSPKRGRTSEADSPVATEEGGAMKAIVAGRPRAAAAGQGRAGRRRGASTLGANRSARGAKQRRAMSDL